MPRREVVNIGFIIVGVHSGAHAEIRAEVFTKALTVSVGGLLVRNGSEAGGRL